MPSLAQENQISQTQNKIKDNKLVIFDTQLSHDSQDQGKELSPWIKKPVHPLTNKQILQSIQPIGTQFLKMIKKSTPIYQHTSQRLQKKEINQFKYERQEFLKRAQQKFKQIIRKSIQDKHLFQTRIPQIHQIKHINLDLNCVSPVSARPILQSFQLRTISARDQFQIQKTNRKKRPFNHQRRLSDQSQLKKHNEVKSDLFFQTLELGLHSYQKNNLKFVKQKIKKQVGSGFPKRPKIQSSKSFGNKDEKQKNEYKIAGEGINIVTNYRSRSNRQKIRYYFSNVNKKGQNQIFLK